MNGPFQPRRGGREVVGRNTCGGRTFPSNGDVDGTKEGKWREECIYASNFWRGRWVVGSLGVVIEYNDTKHCPSNPYSPPPHAHICTFKCPSTSSSRSRPAFASSIPACTITIPDFNHPNSQSQTTAVAGQTTCPDLPTIHRESWSGRGRENGWI